MAKTPDPVHPVVERQRLVKAVAELAVAIDTGACDPTFDEPKALATVCDDHHLLVEAARVRRWMEP